MKKMLKENRVLFALILILIVCFIAICSVVVSYFVGTHRSVYGDRLEEKVTVKEKDIKEYIRALEEKELVKSTDFRVSIRTIYIDIDFVETATLVEAESIAASSLENIKEDVLAYYDVNFILNKEKTETDDGFVIMGAKNSKSANVSWNNNTVIETEAEEE